jgi:hypothetical protein
MNEIGRFLLLGAFLPGLVYTFAFMIYFPELAIKFDCWMRSFRFESTWLAWTAVTVTIGLILSSICFAIELLARKSGKFNQCFPNIEVSKLAAIEVKAKSTAYLNQLLGQAFMHFNIWLGLLLILLFWVFFEIYYFGKSALTIPNIARLIVGLIVILANLYVSKNFYNWAKSAFDGV